MDLQQLLARARACERRAGAIYRTFAARMRGDPPTCAIWTAQARDEDAHERSLARVESYLDKSRGWHTHLDGWEEALSEIEERLAAAERPEIGADLDRQLLVALALERTEIDTLYHRLRDLVHSPDDLESPTAHTDRLLQLAARSAHSGVKLEAALLRARALLGHPGENGDHQI